MKKLITIVFTFVLFIQVNAQQNNIFTKSVKVDKFIPFIVNNFKKDTIKNKNITFLIPVSKTKNITENTIILNQGFRLLSDRLSENDQITLIAYASSNGEMLKKTSVKNIKQILYALNNASESISKSYEDGIQLGYDIANANFDENAVNTIVMIRDLNLNTDIASNKKIKKPKGNAVLLTLLSLTPEVLKILKD